VIGIDKLPLNQNAARGRDFLEVMHVGNIMYLNTVGLRPARKLVRDDIFGNDTALGQK
jgi:hypothetical protein